MTKDIADIPEWFSGCRLNYAENLLKCEEDKVALITYGEHVHENVRYCKRVENWATLSTRYWDTGT